MVFQKRLYIYRYISFGMAIICFLLGCSIFPLQREVKAFYIAEMRLHTS